MNIIERWMTRTFLWFACTNEALCEMNYADFPILGQVYQRVERYGNKVIWQISNENDSGVCGLGKLEYNSNISPSKRLATLMKRPTASLDNLRFVPQAFLTGREMKRAVNTGRGSIVTQFTISQDCSNVGRSTFARTVGAVCTFGEMETRT